MSDNPSKGLDARHGADLFHAGRKEHHGKPHGAKAVASNHEPTKQSPWATSSPVARAGAKSAKFDVPGTVPQDGANQQPGSLRPGTSYLQLERLAERKVAAGESLLSPRHNAKPKARIEHFQSPENTAPRKALRHHDRGEDGTDPLHGKVRSKPGRVALLERELRALENRKPTDSKEKS